MAFKMLIGLDMKIRDFYTKKRIIITIEIVIAVLLAVGELIWAIRYRNSNFIDILYNVGTLLNYGKLYVYRLVAIFLLVDTFYAIVLILINYRVAKYKKILEIFVAALLFAVETIVFLYCRLGLDNTYLDTLMNYVRLFVIFIHINVLYSTVLLVINSENFKLFKAVIAVGLVLIAFLTIWICLQRMTVKADGDTVHNYRVTMNILVAFASIYVGYAVGLMVFDIVYDKLINKRKCGTTEAPPPFDLV